MVLEPGFCRLIVEQKKERGMLDCLDDYFFLLSAKAAAIAITMITAAPMATYVVIGVALVGGTTTWLGVGTSVGAVVC